MRLQAIFVAWECEEVANKKMQGEMRGSKVAKKALQPQVEKMEQSAFGRARHGEESRSQWRGLGLVQEVFGLCAVPLGGRS